MPFNIKPETFLQLDWKTFCLIHKSCVGTLLIQCLFACKSLFLFFNRKCIIKLPISLFLGVNQQTNAKMDNFLLLQNIERDPELRFKSLGPYASDKILQLTNTLL